MVSNIIFGQVKLGLTTTHTYIGTNTSYILAKEFNKHQVEFGMTSIFNKLSKPNDLYLFKNQGFGRNFLQRLGMNIGYSYKFFSYKKLDLSVGYRLFYSELLFHFSSKKAAILYSMIDCWSPEPSFEYFGQVMTLKQYINGQAIYNLTKKISIRGSIGVGLSSFIDNKKLFSTDYLSIVPGDRNNFLSFSGSFSLFYTIKK